MAVADLRSAAEREAAIRTIRYRLEGARFELRQAIDETAVHMLGATLARKLDRALLEIDGALNGDALSGNRQP